MSDDDNSSEYEPSAAANAVKQVQEAVNAATASRTRLPQPLFWSLLRSRITEIKKIKDAEDALRKILG